MKMPHPDKDQVYRIHPSAAKKVHDDGIFTMSGATSLLSAKMTQNHILQAS
jgi:hypothetical protein